MIKDVILINTQGKPRLAKFYEHQSVDKQRELIRKVFSVLNSRVENVSNFMETDSIFGQDSHLVYKNFATLYIVFVFDCSENELAMLDLIQNVGDTDTMITVLYLALPTKVFRSLRESIRSCSVNLSFKGKMLEDVFVETLDQCFKNVYELDIVFSYDKMQTVLDEMILSGQVLETISAEVTRAVEEISKCFILCAPAFLVLEKLATEFSMGVLP